MPKQPQRYYDNLKTLEKLVLHENETKTGQSTTLLVRVWGTILRGIKTKKTNKQKKHDLHLKVCYPLYASNEPKMTFFSEFQMNVNYGNLNIFQFFWGVGGGCVGLSKSFQMVYWLGIFTLICMKFWSNKCMHWDLVG